MSNVYDYVKAINYTKKDVMAEAMTENEYVPFIVNRSLSYFPDTIMYSNVMNLNNQIDHRLQFDYLLHAVRQGRRFSKWAKRIDNGLVDAIMGLHKVNRRRAEESATLLTKEQSFAIIKMFQHQEL